MRRHLWEMLSLRDPACASSMVRHSNLLQLYNKRGSGLWYRACTAVYEVEPLLTTVDELPFLRFRYPIGVLFYSESQRFVALRNE